VSLVSIAPFATKGAAQDSVIVTSSRYGSATYYTILTILTMLTVLTVLAVLTVLTVLTILHFTLYSPTALYSTYTGRGHLPQGSPTALYCTPCTHPLHYTDPLYSTYTGSGHLPQGSPTALYCTPCTHPLHYTDPLYSTYTGRGHLAPPLHCIVLPVLTHCTILTHYTLLIQVVDTYLKAAALMPKEGDVWNELGTSLFFAGAGSRRDLGGI
jgi:hypothetical protein